jgi:hypothetical protein
VLEENKSGSFQNYRHGKPSILFQRLKYKSYVLARYKMAKRALSIMYEEIRNCSVILYERKRHYYIIHGTPGE